MLSALFVWRQKENMQIAIRASIINLCNQIAEIFPLCCKGSFVTGCLVPGHIAHKLQLITFTTQKKDRCQRIENDWHFFQKLPYSHSYALHITNPSIE